MKFRLVLLIATLCLLSTAHAETEQVRELVWDDLVPSDVLFDDPYEKLAPDQMYELIAVARFRDKYGENDTPSEADMADYEEAMSYLTEERVDIDGLLAMRTEVTEKRRKRAETPNKELNGKHIRLPGYLLPLEFKDKKVTEFLLVPWVGACIHTPPPPPNQIVHVRSSEGFDMGEAYYTPVWVTGVMSIESSNPELSYVDGAENIEVTYALSASSVELYDE